MNLTIGSDTFNVSVEGEETLPVVMLAHALGSDLRMWNRLMPELLKHFRVVRYDVRGHGGSTAGDPPYSIADLGRDALAILDTLDIDQVHWIGSSMGGAIGQWLLANAPQRISRAVLANSAAHFGAPDLWNERIIAVQHDGMAAIADATIARWFSDAFAEAEGVQVDSIRQIMLATSPAGYAGCCAALRDLDFRSALYDIEHPVLVIAGRDDASVAPAQSEALAKSLPNGSLVALDAKHMSVIEAAPAVAAATLAFLKAKLTARRVAPGKTPIARPISRRAAGTGRSAAALRAAGQPRVRPAPTKSAPAGKTRDKVVTLPTKGTKKSVVTSPLKSEPAKIRAATPARSPKPPAVRRKPAATTARPPASAVAPGTKTASRAKTVAKPAAKSAASRTAKASGNALKTASRKTDTAKSGTARSPHKTTASATAGRQRSVATAAKTAPRKTVKSTASAKKATQPPKIAASRKVASAKKASAPKVSAPKAGTTKIGHAKAVTKKAVSKKPAPSKAKAADIKTSPRRKTAAKTAGRRKG